jgi:endonuclease-3
MSHFTEKVRRLEGARLALRRRYGEPPRLAVTHPVEHALRAILAEETTAQEAEKALDRLHEHFVDLNDLRVSRPREIREVLGQDFPRSSHKARVIPRLLDQIFKQHNSMVWDFIEAMGKVETRAYFRKLEEVRPFVAAVIARDCAGAHAFPVDNDVARVLARLGILDPAKQSEAKMQAFLERAVKANRAYEVHWLVKRLGEASCLVEPPRCTECLLIAVCPSAVKAPREKSAKRKKKPAARRAPARRAGAKRAAPSKKARATARRKKRR